MIETKYFKNFTFYERSYIMTQTLNNEMYLPICFSLLLDETNKCLLLVINKGKTMAITTMPKLVMWQKRLASRLTWDLCIRRNHSNKLEL